MVNVSDIQINNHFATDTINVLKTNCGHAPISSIKIILNKNTRAWPKLTFGM